MIKKDRLERIMRHLNNYGNTIIVPKDFKGDSLENLLKAIEDHGFKIVDIYFRKGKFDDVDHWTIRVVKC